MTTPMMMLGGAFASAPLGPGMTSGFTSGMASGLSPGLSLGAAGFTAGLGAVGVGLGSGLGVRTATAVPKEVKVGPIPGPLLLGLGMTDSRRTNPAFQVKLRGDTLVCESEPSLVSQAWLGHVMPARDKHEQNMEAVLDVSGTIVFKTVRDIEAGEELLVWYGDTLALLHGIPALSPSNIRGNQRYECTRCMKSYTYPNTLKSHLRFQCVSPLSSPPFPLRVPVPSSPLSIPLLRSPASSVRSDVTMSPQKDVLQTSTPQSAFTPPRRDSVSGTRQTEADSSTSPSSSTSMAKNKTPAQGSPDDSPSSQYYCDLIPRLGGLNGPYGMLPHLPSAYGSPFLPTTALLSYDWRPLLTSPPTPENAPSRDTSNSDTEPEQLAVPPAAALNIPLPSDKAGEPLDLLPRSLYMSRGRKGHWCIYCGKLYSRKYGLKIHLRTHTGYKPLKCKVCLRPFGDPSNLNKHVRLHAEGDTPYRCVHCGKVLVRRRDLDRHIRSRHPDMPCPGDGSEPDSLGDDSAELIDVGTDFPEHPAEITVT